VTFRTRASGMAEFHSEGSVIARPEMADGPPSISTSYTDPRAFCGCRASQCVLGTGPDEGLSLRHSVLSAFHFSFRVGADNAVTDVTDVLSEILQSNDDENSTSSPAPHAVRA